MNYKQNVVDTLVAISSVRSRFKKAVLAGNHADSYRLMGDLLALFICLEGAIESLIKENEALEELRKAA